MDLVLFVCVVFSIVPWVLYLGQGRGRGVTWGVVPAGEEGAGAGAYRRGTVTRWKRGSAPLVVRVAAVSCFYLGQMVAPGALAALLGLAVVFGELHALPVEGVLVLSAPTALIVIASLVAAGWSLLDGEAARPRRVARWSIVHNLVFLALLGLATAADRASTGLALVSCVCACVYLAQAFLVLRAAAAIDAYDAARKQTPAPAHEEDALLSG